MSNTTKRLLWTAVMLALCALSATIGYHKGRIDMENHWIHRDYTEWCRLFGDEGAQGRTEGAPNE